MSRARTGFTHGVPTCSGQIEPMRTHVFHVKQLLIGAFIFAAFVTVVIAGVWLVLS
jgi:hypothetical protein